jgi:hypothetical protein
VHVAEVLVMRARGAMGQTVGMPDGRASDSSAPGLAATAAAAGRLGDVEVIPRRSIATCPARD